MPRKENYSRLLWTTFALALLILVAFQLYTFQEPGRIQAVRAADKTAAIAAGQELFQENCASCHGEEGLGEDAPALNNLAILKDTPDTVFFDLIINGVPGTEMPAWGQTRGGPFTDEQTGKIVAFIRSWEATAPDLGQQRMQVDAKRGAAIFAGTCVICHGADGKGGAAPALNVPDRLQQFDNNWYAQTIAKGRPSQGMPVWGSVLSPQQIGDVVALIDVWRRGEAVVIGDATSLLKNAAHALEHGETDEARGFLEQAIDVAEHEQADLIKEAVAALDAGKMAEATSLVEQAQGMGAETPGGAPMVGMPTTAPEAVSPGAAHLQEAVHALEHNELDEATKALTEAMGLLPPGDLFEAAEHGLGDIEAGKASEALDVLTEALTAAGIPLPEEQPAAPAGQTP